MQRVIILLVLLSFLACTAMQAEKKPDVPVAIKASERQDYSVKSFHAGPRPTDAICIDLNGDGYNDIATSLKKQTLAVLFNDQKGNILNPVVYDTLPHNTSLAAADIDGDGDIDLIPLTESMLGPIFLNDGKGNFSRHDTNLRALTFSWHVESADINNDNLPDFIISSLHRPVIMIAENKGNLNFKTRILTLIPDPDDRDREDIRSSISPSQEKVIRSDRKPSAPEHPGKGTSGKPSGIAEPVESQSGSTPSTIGNVTIAGQSDNEGETAEPGISRLRHDKRIRVLDNAIKDFAIADVNGDGNKDIILPLYIMNAVYIGINDGKGNFEFSPIQLETKEKFNVEYTLSSVAVLYYPDRRLPDIAVSSESDGRIFVFENRDGTFSLKETLETKTRSLLRIRSDDLNGDGLPEIIATFAAPLPQDRNSPVQIWHNSGKGFYLKQTLKSEGFGAYISTCRMSGSGNPYLVISNIHEENLTVLVPNSVNR